MNRLKDYIAEAVEVIAVLLFLVVVVIILSAILISRAHV